MLNLPRFRVFAYKLAKKPSQTAKLKGLEMARYTQQELENLKSGIDLVALVQSKGIKLEAHGKDKKGICPFHQDTNPSMIITPAKNLFNCPACGTGGDVISFVQKFDNISFTQAVDFLLNGDLPKLVVKRESDSEAQNKHKSSLDFTADDHRGINQVIAYYANCLKGNEAALAYLKKRGIFQEEALDLFKIGFSDRTLGLHLASSRTKDGRKLRDSLAAIGLYRSSGHEHFNGSLIFPVINSQGQVSEIYGHKITRNLRKGTPSHLYLPGPHVGIWNPGGLSSPEKTLILTESIIDALTFWVHGFRDVTASYGIGGFTRELHKAFIDNKIEQVFIAYDCDQPGLNAATRLAATLGADGIKCFRVKFPPRLDANLFAQKAEDPQQAFQSLLNSAEFMGSMLDMPTPSIETQDSGQSPSTQGSAPNPAQGSTSLKNPEILNSAGAGNDETQPPQNIISGGAGGPSPDGSGQSPGIPCERVGEDTLITLGERQYRVRGLDKNTSPDILKVNIRALLLQNGQPAGTFYVDTLDLFNARHRKSFMHSVADELKLEVDIIKRDLGKLLLKLEELQEESLLQLLEEEKEPVKVLTPEEEAAALELLRDPNLIQRIISDVRKCGLVGEDTNALVAYLAATSRKTDDPLAVIIQSSSSAGKSSVMNAILAFMPEEEQVIYTAMTGQSLFYMGENQLKHKILAIAEEEGAEQAGYALKILQSEKKLKIASTGKDPKTGRLITQEYNVEGPCVIFMTTTSVEIDEELQNRCLVLTVNEEREQTKRIHELQRRSRTLEGMLQKEDKSSTLNVHANAQRLLKSLMIVNPYAHQLTFLDNRLRARRDNIKYLNLINSIALIHQFQREVKTVEHKGENLPYIEVEISDIDIANKLAATILGTSLDDLAPQTRKLLNLIYKHSKKLAEDNNIDIADVRLTRRTIRDFTGWSDSRLRIHLQRLLDLEYLLLARGSQGKVCVYELLYQGQGEDGKPFSMNLIDTKSLQKCTYDSHFAGQKPNFAGTSHPLRPHLAPTSQPSVLAASTSKSADNKETSSTHSEKHLSGKEKTKEVLTVTTGATA